MTVTSMDLWVVIPAYNEERWITGVLEGLAAQNDTDFRVVVVDNGSGDRTRQLAEDFARGHRQMRIEIIDESEKGTGAAADTGMRHAIDRGATHLARTDADCVPNDDWIACLRSAFDDGVRLVAGQMMPRSDEEIPRWRAGFLLVMVEFGAFAGKLRPGNRGPQYRGPYQMLAGCNMGITTELYEAAGGFPRTKIEDVHEDRALVNAVRTLTTDYALRRDVRVQVSARRAKAWGVLRTLGWYADHRYRPQDVDIR
ncbi:glycosyltransferase family 2 protein [Gordonia sp. NPDC003425]